MPSPLSHSFALNRSELLLQLWNKSSHSSKQLKTAYKSPTILSSPKPRLFALIIGINFYANVGSLRGALADALSFKEYLESHLNVPADQIHTLINKSASRSAIIEAFIRLKNDTRIEKGDPIFIYYAGHGSEITAPPGASESKIQVLIPEDYSAKPGQEVPPIPDRTIGALLTQIAEMKGDNITVVFDCCHSASGTRGEDESTTIRVRSVELDSTVYQEDLDQDILVNSRGSHSPHGFLHSGLRSHMLIAACSSSELAQESDGHGNFSTAFLKLLRTTSPNELRYSDILTHMDQIPSQNPQCEGHDQNRYLFDAKVAAVDRLCFNIALVEGRFVLDAGSIHGITKGAEFAVHPSTELAFKTPLGTLIVETLGPFSATLQPLLGSHGFNITPSAIAVQTKAGEREDIRFYFPLDNSFLPCYEALISVMQSKKANFQNIVLVDRPEDAHLEVAMENGKAIFLIKDERVTQYGLTRLFHSVDPVVEEIVPVLKAAAHYYWKLNRSSNNPDITHNVQVEVYKLQESLSNFDQFGHPEMTPVGPNLCRNNVLDFVVEEDAPYGVKLTNNSPRDFYPNLFYFDNSDLSIGPYYQPPTSGHYALDVPLKKNGGILTIGYGTGGVPPFAYFLRDEQNIDVGFLKLFITTKPVDLSSIPQQTPFEDARSSGSLSKTEIDTWGTVLIPVVQRRYPPSLNNQNDCPQCGFVSATNLDLKAENEDLKRELEIQSISTAQDKRSMEVQCTALRSELEQMNTKLAELTRMLESEKRERANLQAQLGRGRPATPDSGHQRNAQKLHDPRATTKFRKPSLSDRAKRLLGLHA
ncbi:caspase domain-containing protein [Flammula alnicola]|nr:caspase domain-containing protein [Flammula alnicola]